MALAGSQLTGLGSVNTAAGEDDDGAGPFPGFGGAAPAIGPTTGGSAILASRSDHTHPWQTVATLTALAALASATFNEGSKVYVAGVTANASSDWQLKKSALTTDGITVIAASGKSGYQWVRLPTPNPANAIVTRWSVDPANGNDENAGTGATDAASDLVALKTLQEVKRRIWGLELQQAVTIRILNDTATTDIGTWNFSIVAAGSARLKFLGVLGQSTGPGPTVHDNTLYTGSVTGVVVPANVPTADDYQVTDSAIPVSFTASGLLAAGVIFKRTNSTALHFYALKDLGAKTVRITNPTTGGSTGTWNALAVNDTYKAFQMPKIYGQMFPAGMAQWVNYDSVDDETASTAQTFQSPNTAVTRDRNWIGTNGRETIVGFACANCLYATGDSNVVATPSVSAFPQISGGGFRGTGATAFRLIGRISISGVICYQGACLTSNDIADVELEGGTHAVYDCSVAFLQPFAGSRFAFVPGQNGAGFSGKGNSGKLLSITAGGSFYWGFNSATPPFLAGSTSDTSPIQLGQAAQNFRVADLPNVDDVTLDGNFRIGGTAGMGVQCCYVSEEIDFTAAPATYQLVPAKSGYYFIPAVVQCIVTVATGTMVSTITWGAGNNATKDNLAASQANPTAGIFAAVIGNLPNRTGMNLSTQGTSKSNLIDLATPILANVTTAAVLGAASTFKGRMLVYGYLIQVAL